ncbi:hypothetical protein [Cryobacterium sp. Y50]|uniref:hypothetical protein n=1 Tax=Cryobacterium sp. Y50 TaxID=2048286 RepID=UPI001304EA1F|nr:hypothetical protein [Cryobacterium sp. Y50]
MRPRTWFLSGGVLALICVWAVAHVLPEQLAWIPPVLYGLLIVAAGIGSLQMRKSIERRMVEGPPDSNEPDLTVNARADSFPVLLVMNTVLGAYLVNSGVFAAGLACLGITVFAVAWFGVRYRLLRSRS